MKNLSEKELASRKAKVDWTTGKLGVHYYWDDDVNLNIIRLKFAKDPERTRAQVRNLLRFWREGWTGNRLRPLDMRARYYLSVVNKWKDGEDVDLSLYPDYVYPAAPKRSFPIPEKPVRLYRTPKAAGIAKLVHKAYRVH